MSALTESAHCLVRRVSSALRRRVVWQKLTGLSDVSGSGIN